MALDQELEVTSKPSYKFKIRPLVRPRVKLPGQVHATPDARQDPSSALEEAGKRKKKKPEWTKEMKKARDAATAAGAIPARQAPSMPQERNGLEKSRFNNIPGELRNKIYELVLRVPGLVHLNSTYDKGKGGENHRNRPGKSIWKGKAHFLALLSVSHQVHSEATAAFYSCNKFAVGIRFSSHGYNMAGDQAKRLAADLRRARTWLKQIGHLNRSHLTYLEVDLGTWETSYCAGFPDDKRGWWNGTVRAMGKRLLETGVDPEVVFVRVTAWLKIPHLDRRRGDKRCCTRSRVELKDCTMLSFNLPVVRDREAARKAVETTYQSQLKCMNAHAAFVVANAPPGRTGKSSDDGYASNLFGLVETC